MELVVSLQKKYFHLRNHCKKNVENEIQVLSGPLLAIKPYVFLKNIKKPYLRFYPVTPNAVSPNIHF